MRTTSRQKPAGERGRARSDPRVPAADAPKVGSGATPDPGKDLKSLPLADVEKRLGFSPDGLDQAEAQRRLVQYGPNEIAEETTNALLALLA